MDGNCPIYPIVFCPRTDLLGLFWKCLLAIYVQGFGVRLRVSVRVRVRHVL
jgi:hypothetical protein